MVILDGDSLTIDDIRKVALLREKVIVSKEAMEKVSQSRSRLMKLKDEKVVYGVNTGFGALLHKVITREDEARLQENLLRSHASGVGVPFSEEYVRSMLLIRINSLIKGFSGVSPDLISRAVDLLNSDVVPFVPRYGSVGASGDLAPLAHIGLTLMGEGHAYLGDSIHDSKNALAMAGLTPYHFGAKEGVSFINGTSAMSGILAVDLDRAFRTFKSALVSAVLSFEALKGTSAAFTDWAINARKQPGQSRVAKAMRAMIEDSQSIQETTRYKIQDPYTLRCIPQVYGAVLDTMEYTRDVVEREMNSVTDNPLIKDTEVVSAGNFHGEPVALVADFLAIAFTDLGNMIERRIARLTDESLSGLPPFLVENNGLNSGYMIPQYVAAALCNRNKTLCFPSSADSIPTSANQEDHVSMGTNSSIKFSEIVKNLEDIVSIELLLGAQALELARVRHGTTAEKARQLVRSKVQRLVEDRPVYTDIQVVKGIMRSGAFLELCPEL
ncbi:MAG: histidine ammonia-lyase [Thermoplasmataceae archaeon]